MTAYETPENEKFTLATMTGARFHYRLPAMPKEQQEKLMEQLGSYSKMNVAPFMYFVDLTGPLPQKAAERKKVLQKVNELMGSNFAPYLLSYLEYLQHCSSYNNLAAAYRNGTISPGLLAILEEEYIMPEEYRFMPVAEILRKLVEEKKIDFEPFRGEKDIEENWPFFYRIAFSPLSAMPRSIGKIAATNEFSYRGTIEHLKTQVRIILEGEKPAPEMLEKTGGKGADEYIVPPVEPEKLLNLAELIEGQYKSRINEQTPLDFPAPYYTPNAAGFYVNAKTCTVTDLRPYQKELHALLSLTSWDYLKDFANAVREAVREFTEPVKEEPAGDGILQSLFPDVYFAPKEEELNFRNLAISKAEKRLIPAYANAIINGQGITLTDGEGKPLQDIDFIDATGQRSTETIEAFDVSIMNCVGSLQQKYPGKAGFTDIQIAKEFCCTQDKKGHITPESPIVKDVRASMQRISIVYGKIDITEQIKEEAGRRHPNQKKIDTLIKGSKLFGVAQPLVHIKRIAIQTLKNDKDTLLYIIDGPPLFYLHAAITHQIAPVPYEQLNSKKGLTKEARLLREQTRIALETAISMRKRKVGGDSIRFNTILDRTFRTSADVPESTDNKEITEVVSRIQEQKRWKLQRQIMQYLDELIKHGFISSYTVLKKRLPGKKKLIEYGFTFTLPEEPNQLP